MFKHVPVENPLENVVITELTLCGKVLAACNVKHNQAANKEIPLEEETDDDGHPVLVKRRACNKDFDACDREFEKRIAKPSHARDKRSCMRRNIVASVKLNALSTMSRLK